MDAADAYEWLMGSGQHAACDAFDAHVLASILAIGLAEATASRRLPTESIGLSGDALLGLVEQHFPHAVLPFSRLRGVALAEVPADEQCLRDLLWRGSTEASPLQLLLAQMLARRCMQPNHLWQDLGLRNRRELSWTMERHFEPIARRNSQDMKWKKFLYRQICRDEGFRLCTAPVCTECEDFEACFGDESGESRMARQRRQVELHA